MIQTGCDGCPDCKSYRAWSRQHPVIEIMDGDAITDSAEAFYLMRQRGITNVIVMGVHVNMCELGRPFSIRQMVAQGQNVVLMRDMTDAMYNHRSRPWVSCQIDSFHPRGVQVASALGPLQAMLLNQVGDDDAGCRLAGIHLCASSCATELSHPSTAMVG